MSGLAVIPARGGSKRIPRKNIRPFAGKPIIAHAIEAALACPEIERVIVSTDDDEIASTARRLGAEVPFRRPAELADDTTPTVPVMAHAIGAMRALGWPVGYACCIYPAAPFVRATDLTAALELLEARGGRGYSFPVVEFPSPIERALRREAGGATRAIDPAHEATRTQDLAPAFFDAGQFYWAHGETWLAQLAIYRHAHTIVLPGWRAVDIDTPDDWERAERLYALAAADSGP